MYQYLPLLLVELWGLVEMLVLEEMEQRCLKLLKFEKKNICSLIFHVLPISPSKCNQICAYHHHHPHIIHKFWDILLQAMVQNNVHSSKYFHNAQARNDLYKPLLHYLHHKHHKFWDIWLLPMVLNRVLFSKCFHIAQANFHYPYKPRYHNIRVNVLTCLIKIVNSMLSQKRKEHINMALGRLANSCYKPPLLNHLHLRPRKHRKFWDIQNCTMIQNKSLFPPIFHIFQQEQYSRTPQFLNVFPNYFLFFKKL